MGVRELVKLGKIRGDILVDKHGVAHRIVKEAPGIYRFEPPIEAIGPDGVLCRIVGYDERSDSLLVEYPPGEEKKMSPWP